MKKAVILLLVFVINSSSYIIEKGPTSVRRQDVGYLYEEWCSWGTLSALGGADPGYLLTLYRRSKGADVDCTNPPYQPTPVDAHRFVQCVKGPYAKPNIQEIIEFVRQFRIESGIGGSWTECTSLKFICENPLSYHIELPTYAVFTSYDGKCTLWAHAVALTALKVYKFSNSKYECTVSFYDASRGASYGVTGVKSDTWYIMEY